MATMIQQQQERSAWRELLQRFPTFNLLLQSIGELLGYFTTGQFLVDTWRWAILTSGNISEAALMFAALWITAASVEPDAINKLPYGIPAILSAGSMFSLTLLPEIVLYSAIATCYQYWHNTFADREHKASYLPWAILYSIPTLSFLFMTIYTLCSFVSIGHTFAAPVWLLTARCLSGWSYGVVGLIHAAISKKSVVKFDTMSPLSVIPSATITTLTPQLSGAVSVAQSATSALQQAENNDALSTQKNRTNPLSIVTLDHAGSIEESATDSIVFQQSSGKTTDETNAHAKPARGAGVKKASTIIKKNPNIMPTDLAKKANISQTYARQLLAKR